MLGLPNPRSIEAILFDAGGVLMLPDIVAGRRAFEALGCRPNEADWLRAHYASMATIDALAVPDWPLHRRQFASHVGVTDDQLEAAVPLVEELIVSTPWMAVPDAAGTLRSLRDAGYRLGVISNSFGTVEEQLRDGGICSLSDDDLPRVEVIVDSHLVGIEKPDPRIFRLALSTMAVDPERAVYLGDSVKFDIIGATSAGLHSIHIDPMNSCPGAHVHMKAVSDLLGWLT